MSFGEVEEECYVLYINYSPKCSYVGHWSLADGAILQVLKTCEGRA
jgi:hypothetical protein